MINIIKRNKKEVDNNSNTILHEWSRNNELEAIEGLSEAEDIHTLKDLFEIHRVMHEYKKTKGTREEHADTRLLRHSVH